MFVDERDGDEEPQFPAPTPPPPTYGKPSGNGYVVYQTSIHYDPIPPTKSVNDYYTPAYGRGPTQGTLMPPVPTHGYGGNKGYPSQRPTYTPVPYPSPGPPPIAQRPIDYRQQPQPYHQQNQQGHRQQGNVRETRSYKSANGGNGGSVGLGSGYGGEGSAYYGDRDPNGFQPDDYQQKLTSTSTNLARSLPEALAALGFESESDLVDDVDVGGPDAEADRALERAVRAAAQQQQTYHQVPSSSASPTVIPLSPPAGLWRPFYPTHAARHIADSVQHTTTR